MRPQFIEHDAHTDFYTCNLFGDGHAATARLSADTLHAVRHMAAALIEALSDDTNKHRRVASLNLLCVEVQTQPGTTKRHLTRWTINQ